jgi:manganese/zinc/iron transport system substrate-binding protein
MNIWPGSPVCHCNRIGQIATYFQFSWFRLLPVLGFGLAVWGLAACQPRQAERPAGKLRIACTTGMLADVLAHIAGDSAEVMALMGPGVDPHLYKATHGDLKKLTRADLVFYNGLHLEGKMTSLLKKLSRRKPVIALAEALPQARLLAVGGDPPNYDPHLWFDVSLWREVVGQAAQALAKHGSPAQQPYFQANAHRYTSELDTLDREIRQALAQVPPSQRILVTSHDAFGYFGRAYQFEVRGLQGFSTLTDFGLRDINELVDYIVQHQLRAIFVESSVPPKAIEAVVAGCQARGHAVRLAGPLYSDALGAAGTPEGTYVGMVRANARAIAEALR